ncbi:MAG TPA: hypothetical protein IAB87_03845 [Candidatus Coprenecus merdipullorum]|nr:hypothetical protein [Candidatus Coprenecus merdipullorum]
MKALSAYLPVPLLLAALILLSASSCADRSWRVSTALSAADSLMTAQPQAALDTLSSIDSIEIRSMARNYRAFYTLLLTEARYKCYLPVAKDTAISEAVRYYRRRGPEDRLARALTMQGAVFSERSDPEGAMAAYKEAEPIVVRGGDLERLGLLNTQIGALYQQSFINNSAAIARYRRALECFEKAELPRHIMYAHVTLARVLMIDSVETALPHLEKALSMAEQYGDRLCALSASDLLCYIHQAGDNAAGIISTVRKALSKYGRKPQNPVEERLYNSLLFTLAEGYLSTGDLDSARYVCGLIPVTGQVDSMMMFSTYADIAALEGDMETFWENQAMEYKMTLDILKEKYETRLLESELKSDNFRLSSELYKRERGIMLLILFIVLGAVTAVTIFLIIQKSLRRQKAETARLKALADKLDKQLSEQTSLAESKISSLIQAKSTSSDPALTNFFSLTYKAMRKMLDIYDTHQSNPRHLLPKSADTVRKFLTETNSYANTEIILNSVYPDFLDTLFHEFPDLRQEDRHLIMLTCLGYPSGAICAVLGISETNLSTKKSRLAQKMGIGKSLAKYLNERLNAYQTERAERT